MAFIRVKTKKNKAGERHCYAYLVESKWMKRRKQPKQTIKKYLGRVHTSQKTSIEFFQYVGVLDKSTYFGKEYKDILRDLVRWELNQHGVQGVEVDFRGQTVRSAARKTPAVVALNQGYLCDHTLRQLMTVRNSEDEPEGYGLAKALVEAGIEIPKELFVELYQKSCGAQ